MSTPSQKAAAKRNVQQARTTRSPNTRGSSSRAGRTMTTAQKARLPDSSFAFPAERKEPLTDAAHVRNAVARFDQVEGVTDAERDRAWRRIRAAARRYDVEISARGCRDLLEHGNPRTRPRG
jgi:hypothetical protein